MSERVPESCVCKIGEEFCILDCGLADSQRIHERNRTVDKTKTDLLDLMRLVDGESGRHRSASDLLQP